MYKPNAVKIGPPNSPLYPQENRLYHSYFRAIFSRSSANFFRYSGVPLRPITAPFLCILMKYSRELTVRQPPYVIHGPKPRHTIIKIIRRIVSTFIRYLVLYLNRGGVDFVLDDLVCSCDGGFSSFANATCIGVTKKRRPEGGPSFVLQNPAVGDFLHANIYILNEMASFRL
jgi:hypothetical protein